MFTAINFISEKFFHKKLEEASPEEIKVFVDQYPYSGAARLLLAKKLWKEKEDEQAALTASLYINNPLRVSWLLQTEDQAPKAAESVSPSLPASPEPTAVMPEEPEEVLVTAQADTSTGITQTNTESPAATEEPASLPGAAEITRIRKEENNPGIEAEPLVFQSYHTIDYFASQGIRLQQSDLNKDKFGQQLRSFTDWLRSMKKLPSTPTDASFGNDTVVIRHAANSIEEKEILTEAMAEVWAKQGNRERAIATYTKLSLQNPHKSAYFASKIDQLKQA